MAHEEIRRELDECRETGEFVAYHKWGDDPGSFLVGVVAKLSSTQATFIEIDTHGREQPDATSVPLRLIHALDRGTLYLWRLKTLSEMDFGPPLAERDVRKPAEVRALLEDAAREASIVHLWTSANESNDYLVRSVGEETVILTSVVDGGSADGRTLMRLKRILRVRIGRGEMDDTRVHRHGLTHGFPLERSG